MRILLSKKNNISGDRAARKSGAAAELGALVNDMCREKVVESMKYRIGGENNGGHCVSSAKKNVRLRVIVALILLLVVLCMCAGGAEISTYAISANKIGSVGSSARCMITIESSTNRILYAQNAHTRGYMASVTKIITAITVLEICGGSTVSLDTNNTSEGYKLEKADNTENSGKYCNCENSNCGCHNENVDKTDNHCCLNNTDDGIADNSDSINYLDNTGNANIDKKHKIPKNAVGIEGSSIYLCEGEEISVRDLLYGLMLQSGNDCAVALATITAGSVENFAQKMNETATKAGAKNSNFINPHGLHDENHYSTAYDLAVITSYAMKNPTFKEITSCKSRKIERTRTDAPTLILNKNKLLSTLDGADGVKTGFTKRAGRCLVASATRDGMQIISVVLNCGPMFEECGALINRAFKEYTLTKIAGADESLVEIPLVDGKNSTAKCGTKDDLYFPLRAGEKVETTISLLDKYIWSDYGGLKYTTENLVNEETTSSENKGDEAKNVDRCSGEGAPEKKALAAHHNQNADLAGGKSKISSGKNCLPLEEKYPEESGITANSTGHCEHSICKKDSEETKNVQRSHGENANFLIAPLKKGTKIGTISFMLDNRLLFERGLFTIEDAPAMPYSDFLKRIIGEW